MMTGSIEYTTSMTIIVGKEKMETIYTYSIKEMKGLQKLISSIDYIISGEVRGVNKTFKKHLHCRI